MAGRRKKIQKTPDLLDDDQRAAIAWMQEADDSLLAADIGTGKTVMSMTVADRALKEGRVTRWLVVAPTTVASETWGREAVQWSHLEHLEVALAIGPEAARRQKAIDSGAPIVAINYENLAWLMDVYPKPRRGKPDTLPFDGIIYDELDKMKEVSSGRFKSIRNSWDRFTMHIGLTGSLVPKDLTEVWGQTFLIYEGEPWKGLNKSGEMRTGRSFVNWRKDYFYPTDFNQYKWKPFETTREELLEILRPLCFRLKAKGLPEVVVTEPTRLTLPDTVKAKYKELEKEFYLLLHDDHGEHTIDVANAAVLKSKLQQICAGFSYVDPHTCHKCESREIGLNKRRKFVCKSCGVKLEPHVVWHDKRKYDDLDQYIRKLGNKPIIIGYHFKEELAELLRRYPALRWLGGGAKQTDRIQTVRFWNDKKIMEMALHPAAASHGLNLQHSGCQDIFMLTWPWSGGVLKQFCGRLARRGAQVDEVFLHSAVYEDTVDEQIQEVALTRKEFMEDFLDDLDDVSVSMVEYFEKRS